MNLREISVSQERCYEGIIVNVRRDQVRLPGGKLAAREVVEHPGGVAIFAIDAQSRVIMVRQYRYAVGEELLEIPAGKLEYGENPKLCALRELAEETGIKPARLRAMGKIYSSPGIFAEALHLFLAQDLEEGTPHPDEDENLEILRIPLQELLDKIEKGEICDAKTLAGTMKAVMLLRSEGAV